MGALRWREVHGDADRCGSVARLACDEDGKRADAENRANGGRRDLGRLAEGGLDALGDDVRRRLAYDDDDELAETHGLLEPRDDGCEGVDGARVGRDVDCALRQGRKKRRRRC